MRVKPMTHAWFDAECRADRLRAGLKHVRSVRRNGRNFRGVAILNPKKIPCELTRQFEQLCCLDYKANPDINDDD